MKNFKPLILLLIVMISFLPSTQTKAQSVSISFSTFQQELSPYGRWMNNPRFGQVWINNDAGFKPYYTDGHWEYTNYGWSWESDYDWGWAPFHYGRWEYDQYYGWMWIPGYEWAPAWVSWSSYDDYYGWAPLGYGININVSFGSIPYDRWNFIPRRNICDRDFYRHHVSHGRNNNFRNAVVINNYYNGNGGIGRYMRGPERREVERYTSNRIPERRIDYNDNYRNRNNRNNNAGNDNNRNGRRNNDGVNQSDNNNPGNVFNRRNRDVNNDNGGNRQGTRPGEANTNGANDNSRRRRGENTNADNNTIPPVFENRRPQRDANSVPQTNENNNRRRPDANTTPPVYENRRPQRDVNTVPQTNENNNPGRRQNENRTDRNSNQQNSNPQRQQQIERPAPQQRMERQAPQQQTQPAPQQRSMERRVDPDQGRNNQQSNGNGDWKSGRRREN